METSVFNVLVLIAFGLMVIISGGVGYLTLAEWRDRRRRDQDSRGDRPLVSSANKVDSLRTDTARKAKSKKAKGSARK